MSSTGRRVGLRGWYVCDAAGSLRGPLATTEVIERVCDGSLDEDALVCEAGERSWRAVDSIDIFREPLERARQQLLQPLEEPTFDEIFYNMRTAVWPRVSRPESTNATSSHPPPLPRRERHRTMVPHETGRLAPDSELVATHQLGVALPPLLDPPAVSRTRASATQLRPHRRRGWGWVMGGALVATAATAVVVMGVFDGDAASALRPVLAFASSIQESPASTSETNVVAQVPVVEDAAERVATTSTRERRMDAADGNVDAAVADDAVADEPAVEAADPCANLDRVPTELCFWLAETAAGRDADRPLFSVVQRFLLDEGIDRVSGKIIDGPVAQNEGGDLSRYLVTSNGVFGYCLDSATDREAGRFYSAWVIRPPGKTTQTFPLADGEEEDCVPLSEVTLPDALSAVMQVGPSDPKRRELAERALDAILRYESRAAKLAE